MPRASYQLTEQLIAAHAGASILCLADVGIGRRYRLHAARPGVASIMRLRADGTGLIGWCAGLPSEAFPVQRGGAVAPIEPKPGLIRVDIMGPITSRAGFEGECGGWTDGNDAITERLIAAFAEGDVLLYGDTPGGDPTGCQQGIAKVLAAKARYGRRCTGFCNELIASLGVWWMASVCDEIFTPAAGVIGSIGARAGHKSIARALDAEGVDMTYFADPPDKVALAPELPLSAVGRARGQRDVKIVGDAFRAAVCGSPLGMRGGLTPEYLIELGADALTGQAAKDAGLCDDVASEEDVMRYALKMAESAAKNGGAQTRARGARAMTIRAEGDEEARARAEEDQGPPSSKPGKGDGDGDEAKGIEPPTKCGKCSVENSAKAKFCMHCGAPMSEARAEAAVARAARAPRLSLDAGYAELAGVRPDASAPVIKGALVPLVNFSRRVMAALDVTDPERAAGAFDVLIADVARLPGLEARIREQDKRAKLELGLKIAALNAPGFPPGDIVTPVLNDKGERIGTKLTREYERMSVEELDEKHRRLASRAPAPKPPFEADRAAAEAAKEEAEKDLGAGSKGEPTKAQIEAAMKNKTVLDIHAKRGGKLEDIAAAFLGASAVVNGGAS